MKRALIVSNKTALNGYQSGASLRVLTIFEMLKQLQFETEVTDVEEFRSRKPTHFDLIVLTPFSAAKVAYKARRATNFLWFDSCDSWISTRLSRLKHKELQQILALIQDWMLNIFHPKYDLLSYISLSDARNIALPIGSTLENSFIFPNYYKELHLNVSEQKKVVFIGDGDYKPNQDAVQFLGEVTKFISSDIKIHIIGKNFAFKNPALVFEGYRDERDLYFSRDIHVAPVFAGAGIKNKVAIPLTLGLDVVTTKHGANGLKDLPKLRIAESPLEFAKAIEICMTGQYSSDRPKEVFSLDQTVALKNYLRILFE